MSAPSLYSPALLKLAAPAWVACEKASAEPRIPDVVHQPWLHGSQLRWEHVLGMVSVRWIAQPRRYVLYYDRLPPPSEEWRCACRYIATDCVKATPPRLVPGTNRPLKLMHRPDMMRLELLIRHGGIFLDHDAYVLRPLDELRRCCPPPDSTYAAHNRSCAAAPVVAGFEQATSSLRKMNPGVLLAERGSPFLQMIRQAWKNYSTLWDYNCCEV